MIKLFKEILGFLLTFIVIFSITFVFLNFGAFKSFVDYYLYGKDKTNLITEVVGDKKIKQKLLPVQNAKKLVKIQVPSLHISIMPIDYRLVIPKLGKNVPLVKMSDAYITDDLWGKFEKEVQESLRMGVVHYPGTANPGQNGNVFFTGHSSYYPWDHGNYKDVFANLNLLEIGDEYIVYFEQNKYRYQIVEKKEVRPSEVHVLDQPPNQKLSTLMTCWPIGTTIKRLILVAEQI